jgi:small membrane protein
MDITIIQVLIVLFALFAWSRAFLRMRGKDISVGEFSFWSLIWITVILVGIFPKIITIISGIVGIGRGVDLAVYVSIILLFYLIFRIYVNLDNQKNEITKLVRELSIRDAKIKHLESKSIKKKK